MTKLYKSKLTGGIYSMEGMVNKAVKSGRCGMDIYVSEEVLLQDKFNVIQVPLKHFERDFEVYVKEMVEPIFTPTEDSKEDKFEAVFGDQSLFDLVGATDEHLYIVRNAKHTGIYATEHSVTKDRILAERKLKEPEFIRYHTDTYLHEDEEFDGVDITAFRDRSGNACINVSCNPGNVEVVLNKGMTVLFANELIAIANGVERQE